MAGAEFQAAVRRIFGGGQKPKPKKKNGGAKQVSTTRKPRSGYRNANKQLKRLEEEGY